MIQVIAMKDGSFYHKGQTAVFLKDIPNTRLCFIQMDGYKHRHVVWAENWRFIRHKKASRP